MTKNTETYEKVRQHMSVKYAHLDYMSFRMRGSLCGDYREALADGVITQEEYESGEKEMGSYWKRARND
jgi:hypothetical protein